MHTIKGTCGFLGLPRLERVAHAAENVLGKVRDGVLAVTPDVISQVLTALDRIKLIVAGLAATEAEPAGDDSALIAALDRIAAGQSTAPAAAAADPTASAPQRSCQPGSPPKCRRWRCRRRTDATSRDARRAGASPSPDRPGTYCEDRAAAPAEAAPADTATADSLAAQQTIRVTVDVLEDLMTLVSELVLTRNQLLQLARTQENSQPSPCRCSGCRTSPRTCRKA